MILAGVAVLASCAPPADSASPEPTAPHSEARRPRRTNRTTTTLPPVTTAPTTTAPATTVPSTATPPTTAPPAPTTTAPSPGAVLPVGPAGLSGTWKLKFADEFSGTSLDTTKWRPNWFGANDSSITRPINDYEESCYDPAQVTVSGGVLSLTAVKLTASRPGCTKKNGATASYASGMLSSNHDYRFTYGYIEARIHLPGDGGLPENWAAFWANGQDWPATGEIDVMETLGGEPRWHYHYEASNGSHAQKGSEFDLISPKTGWHTFGALWEPGRITYYYDGVAVGSVTSGVTSAPMYLILNNGISDYISGPIVAPSTMQVDYVRHWQR